MPQEQPHLSKNAKDKSNNKTLLTLHKAEDAVDSSGQGSCHSSEKDSGYSDGSDWQQTDVEESNKGNSSGNDHVDTSRPGQNQEPVQVNLGSTTLIPAGSQFSPRYIINNMAYKQPDMIQKRGQLSRRNLTRVTGSSGAAHMILLKQPSLFLTNLQLNKPPSLKHSSTGKVVNSSYLPILNSYPRIAPHPSKKPPGKSTLNDGSQNLTKRVCTEHKIDTTTVTKILAEQDLQEQPNLAVATSGQLCSSSTSITGSFSSPTAVSSTQVSSSGSSLYSTSSSFSTRGHHRNGSTSARHCRLLNTVEILRQSGLLDITLRTKELLRQSNATERDIAQLRQDTELLCQAVSNASCNLNGVTTWEHLHRSMAESGSYPNLQSSQTLCHPDSDSQRKRISRCDTDNPLADKSAVSPSHFPSTIVDPNQNHQQAHSGQGRKHQYKSSEKVTVMPPDSSTG